MTTVPAILRTVFIGLILCVLCLAAPTAYAQDKKDDKRDGYSAPVAATTDVEQLRASHAAYLEHGELQLERPEPEPEPDVKPRERSEPPEWLQAIFRFIGDLFTGLGPFLKIILWLVVIGLVAALIWFIAGEAITTRFGWGKKKTTGDEDDVLPDLRPDSAAARSLLEEADALARNGQFAEAVHLLLFRSIEDIQSRQTDTVSQDLTAREIGRLDTLPEKPRSALSPIIRLVESSFFGGRAVDETGWNEARASYEAFAFGEAWT
ncbi:MAG: hypothetical protein V3V03_02880 [Hyphomonadaceae bacterium]